MSLETGKPQIEEGINKLFACTSSFDCAIVSREGDFKKVMSSINPKGVMVASNQVVPHILSESGVNNRVEYQT